MKKKLALLTAPIALLAASATMAANPFGDVRPYVGIDAESRHMNFQKGFGNNLFNHNYPQGNLYAGLRLNEYLAVEAGYEATERKTKTSTLLTGDTSLGIIIPRDPDTGSLLQPKFNSQIQIKGPHASLVGMFPISDANRLQLIGTVGLAHLKTSISRTLVVLNGTAVPTGTDGSLTTFVKRKSVLRLGAGIQHMINCNWGVRAMLKWENSNKLKLNSKEDQRLYVNPKNSIIYSLGAFFNF
jgi:opacity protein-like surface antigen